MMRLFWAIGVVATVAACATVQSNYTKFDNLPGSIEGKTVAFFPLEGQNGSAEWETYARKVADRLSAHGFTRIDDVRSADYAAVLWYGAGDTRTTSGVLPLYGQTGGGTSTFAGNVFGGGNAYNYSGMTYTAPTYGITGFVPYTVSQTDRFFTLRMIDVARSTQENLVAAYEGTVISTGVERSFPEVADCMIGALLVNFRGSGTDSVTVAKDDC